MNNRLNSLFLINCLIFFSFDSFSQNINWSKIIKQEKFVNGYYCINSDTIFVPILKLKGRNKKINYTHIAVKTNVNSYRILSADSITEYSIENIHFYQHNSNGTKFFIKKTISGKVNLYERESIDLDQRFLYFIQFPDQPNLYSVSPFEQNVSIVEPQFPQKDDVRSIIFKSKNINEKFKIAFSGMFSDCKKLKNMILAEFYTISDIPSIINMYNNCN